jgi:flagellin
MSLGVLNNLSAVYAENNLNNTNNSLNTVLQQLSSGSKINSGADDAAGLSLVDGLQANQMALNQSQTNATEGAGLLQVADGALSQVTSLLNRAVTLATESSNGTLNTTQDAAANQEYQSILSEISNIGSTTTYNQEQVFNSNTAIYTGDSTQQGSSVDDLNIRSLSSSNLGDTGGAMAYSSSGANGNVFIDLSHGVTAAKATDVLNAATSSITIDTLSTTGTAVANTVSVGAGTGYADTVQGMIGAINNSGLGVTASLTTDEIAGSAATGDTGIMIQGAVGTGTSSVAGTATYAGAANTDAITGAITLQAGKGPAMTFTAAEVTGAEGNDKLNSWVTYVNAQTADGVTAGDVVAGVLSLASTTNTNQLTVVNNTLVDSTIGPADAMAYTPTTTSVATPTQASFSGSITGGTSLTDNVTGSLTVQEGTNAAVTITAAQVATADNVAQGAVTLQDYNNYINADNALGITSNLSGTNGGTLQLLSTNGTDALKVTSNLVDNSLTAGPAALAYTGNAGYADGVVNSNVYDTTSGQSANGTFAKGTATSGGVATMTYADKAGQSLSATDLSTQNDAESALIDLNASIADVAGQDGYIGAQINTLNAVSSVLSTQSENVQSAQNAVQATDYASATSNMSKYEILSQTGIAALAQANSQQQGVLKLLQ